jgi:hypothetical protein
MNNVRRRIKSEEEERDDEVYDSDYYVDIFNTNFHC